MRNNKVKRLWGQKFRIVKEGLAEPQVVAFVNDLMSQYSSLTEQQQHRVSLDRLAERTVVEAEKLAESIKEKAKREAEAEAARISAEAEQQARAMIKQAEGAAKAAADQKVQDILLEAAKKATIIEAEARKKAEELLVKSKEEREREEGEASEGAKRIYYRLLSALENFVAEWRTVEAEWKAKPQVAAEPALAPEIAEPTLEPPVAVEEEAALEERIEEPIREEIPAETPLVEEAIAARQEPIEVTAEQLLGPEVEPEEQEQEGRALYQGEIELALVPPIHLAALRELHKHLQATPQVRVLRIVGSWAEGTAITVFLEKPTPLVDILAGIPTVEAAAELPKTDTVSRSFIERALAPLGSKGGDAKRVVVALKTPA